MTRPSEREQLQAEKADLQRLLDGLPEESVIERMGLEARLDTVKNRLEAFVQQGGEPARASLTFRGEPVVGSEGILADFGAVALQKFEQVVATFGAYLRTGELGASGPLPAREEHRLMITGTAVGSFGFELEERSESGQAELGVVDSSAREALERVVRVMEGALDSEEALAEEVSDLDARSLRSLHDFMSAVANREAWFRLEAVGHQVEFPDALQVHRTAERLQEDNLFEEEVELKGELKGYLPNARAFELDEEALGLVKGKIAPAVEHPDELARYMNQRVAMRVRKTVLGGGRPRFALLALPQPAEQGADS